LDLNLEEIIFLVISLGQNKDHRVDSADFMAVVVAVLVVIQLPATAAVMEQMVLLLSHTKQLLHLWDYFKILRIEIIYERGNMGNS
jgi:hypothetical protein